MNNLIRFAAIAFLVAILCYLSTACSSPVSSEPPAPSVETNQCAASDLEAAREAGLACICVGGSLECQETCEFGDSVGVVFTAPLPAGADCPQMQSAKGEPARFCCAR